MKAGTSKLPSVITQEPAVMTQVLVEIIYVRFKKYFTTNSNLFSASRYLTR